MKGFKPSTFIAVVILLLFIQCNSKSQKAESNGLKQNPPENFGEYWYQGEAELTSYHLEQARYGEIHKGNAVLIFVTESFSKSKHVKLDNPQQAGDDAVTVMKLNKMKKFTTGIYPYSMMTSVFTPVYGQEYPYTFKVTTSSQEWCGHTFTQLNLKDAAYHVSLKSYFESEGDKEFNIERTWLEDEIWTRIRTQPENLPTGEIKVIPGTMYTRLRHQELQPVSATANLTAAKNKDELMKYQLIYKNERELNIYFEKSFPHKIIQWDETYTSGFGTNQQKLTTKATIKKTIKLDYWNRNSVKDSIYRKELELE